MAILSEKTSGLDYLTAVAEAFGLHPGFPILSATISAEIDDAMILAVEHIVRKDELARLLALLAETPKTPEP